MYRRVIRLLLTTSAIILAGWSILSLLAVGLSGDYANLFKQFPHQFPTRLLSDVLMFLAGMTILVRSRFTPFLVIASTIAFGAQIVEFEEITEIVIALAIAHVVAVYCLLASRRQLS